MVDVDSCVPLGVNKGVGFVLCWKKVWGEGWSMHLLRRWNVRRGLVDGGVDVDGGVGWCWYLCRRCRCRWPRCEREGGRCPLVGARWGYGRCPRRVAEGGRGCCGAAVTVVTGEGGSRLLRLAFAGVGLRGLVLERGERVRCCVVEERVAVGLRSMVCSFDIVLEMQDCASGGSEIVEHLCGRSSSSTFISRHIACFQLHPFAVSGVGRILCVAWLRRL